MSSASIDALIVTSLPNVAYLTNFTGSAAIVVLTPDDLIFITDSRYVSSLNATRGTAFECPSLRLEQVDGAYDVTLTAVLGRLGPVRAGFEAAHLSVGRYRWFLTALGIDEPQPETPGRMSLIGVEDIVEAERVCKDAYELEVLAEGGRRLSRATPDIFAEVRAGRTEREVALAIDWHIRRAGFERAAFETIVASGENAALPHARPSERKLAEGELVVLDFGGVYDSYCVDLTRTVSIGEASDRARRVYDAVRAAHDRAIAAVYPGAIRFAIDQAARDTLAASGFADAFGHGTGHGLGLEIHEAPRIVRRRPGDGGDDDDTLREGMVFTIEPGAYFFGWSGVRLEDDVAVTSSGVTLLTDVPTELLEL